MSMIERFPGKKPNLFRRFVGEGGGNFIKTYKAI